MSEGPEHGARFELSRQSIDDRAATYELIVLERQRSFAARATLAPSGIDVHWTSEPPRWIADTMLGFLKTLRKNHADDAGWPARLVRWRAERE